MKEKRVAQCKCCGLHYFDNINENYCETCSRFIAEYTKQVRKEVCEEIISKGKIKYGYSPSHKDGIKQVLEIDKEILDQIQEDR